MILAILTFFESSNNSGSVDLIRFAKKGFKVIIITNQLVLVVFISEQTFHVYMRQMILSKKGVKLMIIFLHRIMSFK